MTATVTEEDLDISAFEDLVADLDTPWVVVVLDDPVTPMDYVVHVFMEYFHLSQEISVVKMMEIHTAGRSVLASGTREEMIVHKRAMNDYKLQAKVEKES